VKYEQAERSCENIIAVYDRLSPESMSHKTASRYAAIVDPLCCLLES
jgi:hypothetical protein